MGALQTPKARLVCMSYDPELGAPYRTETIKLGQDAEGPLVATLIQRPAQPHTAQPDKAVLYLHGFSDYFFQRQLGDWWAERGYSFYALELRKYGRSIRPGQTPNYTQNLADYYQDLDAAWQLISQRDGHQQIIFLAHSTGGLIASLWVNSCQPAQLQALILNSPWLDHFNHPLERALTTAAVKQLARLKPRAIVQKARPDGYASALHRNHGGLWDFNLTWKPLETPDIYAGWLAAIRRGHQELQAGLNIRVPILLLTSARSGKLKNPGDRHDFDAILKVQGIRRYALGLGPDVHSRVIEGAVHDVFLSAEPARKQAYQALADFTDQLEGH